MSVIDNNPNLPPKSFIPRQPNLANALGYLDPQLRTLALGVVATSAIFQCAIQINQGLKEEQAMAAAADIDGTGMSADKRNVQDEQVRSAKDAPFELRDKPITVAEAQGHARHGQDFFDSAALLGKLHSWCWHEVRKYTSNPRRLNGCSSIENAIQLFEKGQPMNLNAVQQAAQDRLASKGVIDVDQLERSRIGLAKRQGESWKAIHDDVQREYDSLMASPTAHDDQGVSNLSEETMGEHCFNMLPAGLQLRLWDKVMDNLRPAFQRWANEIVLGIEREFTIEEAESLNEILGTELAWLRLCRTSFYVEHQEELADAPGLESWNRTPKEPPKASAEPLGDRAAKAMTEQPLKDEVEIKSDAPVAQKQDEHF